MLRRLRSGGDRANKLIDAVEPNTASWTQDQEDDTEPARSAADLVKLYGPNGLAVGDVLDAVAELDFDHADRLRAAYIDIPDTELAAAKQAVGACHDRRHGPELDRALVAIIRLIQSHPDCDDDPEGVYYLAQDVALAAAQAIILEAELDDVTYATLRRAWDQVMVSPVEMPERDPLTQFGPNTGTVDRFLTRLAAVSEAETSELVAAWERQPQEVQETARRHFADLIEAAPDRREQTDLAMNEVFAWMNGRKKSRDYSVAWTPGLGRLRMNAVRSVGGAICAIVLADLLTAGEFETLSAPWAETIGTAEVGARGPRNS
jgi:hypothetical protein